MTTQAESIHRAQTAESLFVGACDDVRKAWFQTNMLGLAKGMTVKRVRQQLRECDAPELVALTLDVMGPIRPLDLRAYMGDVVAKQREAAGLVLRLCLREALQYRAAGEMLDVARVKALLLQWIRTGGLEDQSSPAAKDLARIGALIAERTTSPEPGLADILVQYGVKPRSERVDPSRIRLALVAPLAPALESMLIVAGIDEGLVAVMGDQGPTEEVSDPVRDGGDAPGGPVGDGGPELEPASAEDGKCQGGAVQRFMRWARLMSRA